MGSLFRARIGVVQTAGLARDAAAHGYTIVATDRSGAPVRGFVFPERCIVAVCHERRGLAALAQWDAVVAVPQREHGESLNAAVAGSIVLYELAEQRRMLSSGLSTRRNA